MNSIVVDSISKRFLINHAALNGSGRYRMLREAIIDKLLTPLRKLRNHGMDGQVEEFWAVRDVSFTVREGEVVGVIGRNGAGKSTLLKILTRITDPTSGEARLHGRVGSLLEVGTGFHPELTGRENVVLNASILGMNYREVKKKFDEIVAFSGVEKFLDTPVKKYSSGMKVRLAFSVAAHLDLEILLVDEVLSVGDVEFQKKCMGKMDDVARSGRTILFVSHNLTAVQNLCQRTIWLHQGRIAADGSTETVTDQYLDSYGTTLGVAALDGEQFIHHGSGEAEIKRAEVCSLDGEPIAKVRMGEGFTIRMQIASHITLPSVVVGVVLFNAQGVRICGLNSSDTAAFVVSPSAGETMSIDCAIPQQNLMAGHYRMNLWLKRTGYSEMIDLVEQCLGIEIVPADVFHTGNIPKGSNVIFLAANWWTADRPRLSTLATPFKSEY